MDEAMWLPAPLYEALPWIYIVVGAVFLAGVAYIGMHVPMAPVYLSLGIISILSGLLVFALRRHKREQRAQSRDVSTN